MKGLTHILKTLRHLSLDVVLGALASGSMVVWMLRQEMPWIWWLALPMAVWVIYTTDHLLDAYRLKDQAHTERHLFHHRYFRLLLFIWLALLLSCLSWVPLLAPLPMVYLGLGMGLFAAAHLGLVLWIGSRVSWLFHKELGVALVYAAGVWGGPLVMMPGPWPGPLLIAFLQFFLLALINLLFFSYYEKQTDQRDGHTSIVLAIGAQNARKVIAVLGGLFVGLGAQLLTREGLGYRFWVAEGVMAVMLLGLLGIAFLPSIFRKNERYRIWGDGLFMLPAVVWLL
jgi:hypothetical protein